jgi:poly-gamma-glutamate synthesis protein (capsule biosynthesis protein)
VCSFENGRLQRIEVVPVTLDHGRPVHHRGRPRLARGEEAEEILARFTRLSKVFGTRVGRDKRDEPPHATIQL